MNADKTDERRCAVSLLPAKDAVSRTEYLSQDIGMTPELVTTEAFLLNLNSSKKTVSTFASAGQRLDSSTMVVGSVSDHEVRQLDMRALVSETTTAMADAGEPLLVQGTDILSYPRVLAVWQVDEVHKVLEILENNDNTALVWWVGKGQFDRSTLKLQALSEVGDENTIFDAAPFLDKSRTIYPHIEEYVLCDEV